MYVIRHKDFKEAIHPKRKLVKLSDPNLWKPPWPEGIRNWEPGHEIRSEAISISLFTTFTPETKEKQKNHWHERIWELYQVVKDSLKIAVRPYKNSKWEIVELQCLDILLLAPGTAHLVDWECTHTT